MVGIKKVDILVLKSFVVVFWGRLFMWVLILMMELLWRYVDEVVGKGLEMNVVGEFLFL